MLKMLVHPVHRASPRISALWRVALVVLPIMLTSSRTAGEYAIPAGRKITWYPAGLDVVGGIPTRFAATNTITGLHPNGSVDDSVTIANAIQAAASNTVLYIPAGKYKITMNQIPMKNGVVLRGASPCTAPWLPNDNTNMTTLLMTNGATFYFRGGDKTTSWYPGAQSGIAITSGYTQGSTNLTLASASGLSAGDYLAVYQNKDTALIDDKGYTWLGEDSGPDPHVWAQYTQIRAISGNTVTIDPPLYQVTPSPTGQSVRKQTFGISMAGLENLRLYGDDTNYKLIWFQFCKNCWVKGCETYDVGADSSGSPHIWTEFCYANEYRRNYHHHGASHDSGANYGIEFYHWNSRHKVEDNIVRDTRHSIVFEGGGSGCVLLYNFTDDNWESVQGAPTTMDNTILSESPIPSHGAHPYMNLWEGNSSENMEADYTQGSSSHNTLFRNSLRGYRSSFPLSSPWFWNVVEIQQYCRFYNIIGNIVGSAGMSARPGWSGGTLYVTNSNDSAPLPVMFRFGYSSDGGSYQDLQSYSTAVLQGNYDFLSQSVNKWADPDHTLPVSLYYTNYAKPSWFADRAWPPYDYTKVTAAQIDRTNIPAGYRYVFGVDPPPSGNAAPVAVANASPTNGPAPLLVSFSSAGSYDPEGAALTYTWTFGDGGTSIVANPSYTYQTSGTYQALLRVSDGTNTTSSGLLTITVRPPAPTGLHVVGP